ncbi:hypothetical protein [Flavivirga aquatica]|nr:hypothetical protein [Flavivirga aquatica]
MSIIFISHRLHSLKHIADRIYTIEDGNSNISGSHEQLICTFNFYSAFWKDIMQLA